MFGSQGKSSNFLRRSAAPVVWAAALVLIACPDLLAVGMGNNFIRGKVTGPGGRPVEVELRLRNAAGYVVDTAFSDSNGEFYFRGVQDGTFHVVVEDNRYKPADVTARVEYSIITQDFVYIALEPRNGHDSSETPYADGSRTVSVKELKTNFPKAAVKEYEKGNSKMEHGKVEEAITHFEKAVQIAPSMYPALNNLGTAYLQMREMGKAEAILLKAMAANPNSADSYVNLGHVYYEAHQYDAAEKSLERGLARNPASSLAYFFLGLTYVQMGRLPDAEVNLKKALSQNDPDVATARLILASLYIRAGENHKASDQLREFLKDWPSHPQAAKARQILARLKGTPTQ